MKKKFLFLQFRENRKAALSEKKSFLRVLKIPPSQFKIKNFFREKVNLSRKEILKFDGLIIGGSSEFSLSEKKEKKELWRKVKKAIDCLENIRKEKIPILGICFGHQILAYILGGEIGRVKNQEETGSSFVFLTEKGKSDLLFSGLPGKFIVQQGHKDSLKKLPPGAILLAKGRRCKIQAFRFKNIYGVQFHPELNLRDVKLKLKENPDYRRKNMKFKPSPQGAKILRNFSDLIC